MSKVAGQNIAQLGEVRVATAKLGNAELDGEASRMLSRWRAKGFFIQHVAIVPNPLDITTFIGMYVLEPAASEDSTTPS